MEDPKTTWADKFSKFTIETFTTNKIEDLSKFEVTALQTLILILFVCIIK